MIQGHKNSVSHAPDFYFMLWRAITAFPVVLVASLIFIRTRRLLSLIVVH